MSSEDRSAADDREFEEICRILGASTAAPSGLERLGVRIEVDDAAEAPPSTLGELRSLIGDCRRCGLCASRTNLVFSSGPQRSRLMVIGEAPGADEDESGIPFVGPAGQMLDRMLTNVLGLSRSEVHVTNALRCRPPGNRDPLPEELSACAPFLSLQRDVVAPDFVLLLGSVAARAVLGGGEGITRRRGRWHRWGEAQVLATFHPAYLLRKPEDKSKALEDLVALRDALSLLPRFEQ